jgi:hypothetical protein
MKKNAKIIISRKYAWRDSLRNYSIFVNGEKVGKIKSEETVEIPVPSGEIEIYLRHEFVFRSRKIKFEAPSGQKNYFVCQGLTGWKSVFSLFIFPLLFIKYIDLERVESEQSS